MHSLFRTLAFNGLLCAGLGVAGAAFAQDQAAPPPPSMQQEGPGGPGMHGRGPMTTEQQLQHLTRALNLSSDQQAQIKPILDDRRQQMMQMHGDQSLTREDRMAKFKTLDDQEHAKIATILNDEQKTKFEKMAERREAKMEHHGGPMGGPQQAPPPQPQ